MNTLTSSIDGFSYADDFLTTDEETHLIAALRGLPFAPLTMYGHQTDRRIVCFGLHYDGRQKLLEFAPPIPDALASIRGRAASLAGVEPSALAQALITEYPAKASIGLHIDNRSFGSIICGVSLDGAAVMTIEHAGRKEKVEIRPRSLYIMRDAARWYRHALTAKAHRYSITFRTIAADEGITRDARG